MSSKNALKHGACALSTLILPTESLPDFQQLEANWFAHYSINPDNPKTQHETDLIKSAVRADWLAQRSERVYVDLEAKYFTQTPDPSEWTEDQHRNLARFLRYRTSNTNLFAKARKAVDDCWRNRTTEDLRQQTMRHREEKNKPELTWDEEIAQLKDSQLKAGRLPPLSEKDIADLNQILREPRR